MGASWAGPLYKLAELYLDSSHFPDLVKVDDDQDSASLLKANDRRTATLLRVEMRLQAALTQDERHFLFRVTHGQSRLDALGDGFSVSLLDKEKALIAQEGGA